ncbi:helical backbone metal receptor [Oryzobacter sp. R7]|uniref:helical backbone metal receptor n=1 Tax=Oryzobacter faecalis TaxID=3388656 RepID=UPI00398D2746
MTVTLRDDLGAPVPLAGPVRRVVSLVPSLTEALAATCPERLVGATDWCTHPADLDERGVARVRGTKNPDLTAVAALAPDLVVANQEENRELDVRRLRERGVPVWVTVIETVPEALATMRRLFRSVLGVAGDPEWLVEAAAAWSGPVPSPHTRAVVPIWRDPWMVVGRPTFTADLLARAGIEVVTGGGEGRYPRADPEELDDPEVADVVLLPDEPYVFTGTDGPEAFSRLPTRLVSGRLLTWYGPSLVPARISFDRT